MPVRRTLTLNQFIRDLATLSLSSRFTCGGLRVHLISTHFYIDCHIFLNQARAGRRPSRAWFLKIDPMRMSVCVCVRPRGY